MLLVVLEGISEKFLTVHKAVSIKLDKVFDFCTTI